LALLSFQENGDNGMKEQDYKTANSSNQKSFLHSSLPWIFQHDKLFDELETQHTWDRTKLINKLNHINFSDGYIYFLFHNEKTGERILIKAYPQPCIHDTIICRLDIPDNLTDLTKYKFSYLMIEDGRTITLAPAEFINREGNMMKVRLPENSYTLTKRKTKRFSCRDITCEVSQDNYKACGHLVDFTPMAFGITFSADEDVNNFHMDNPALVNLVQNGIKLFSGPCRFIRLGSDSPDGKVVFTPVNTHVPLFPKRETRNPRQHIVPAFSVKFEHPFIKGAMERDIFDISTSGFSVRDNVGDETLLPGMIIPNMTIVYAGILKMKCSAQVIYRHEEKDSNIVICGLAIADMDIQSYSYLNHILGTYIDNYARVSTEVDMDALWEFFFDTNFIYGEKYEHLQPHRETFKETYRKLYQDNPEIARHFVYEKNGKIYGHNAMVHAYNPSWMIHHLAARPMESKVPGLTLIKQTTLFITGLYHFTSAKMDYVMLYYRPENRVMDSVFGGFARHLNNPKGSSLDLFSYIHFQKDSFNNDLPTDWILRKCIPSDFAKLHDHSGGLLLSALDLDSSTKPLNDAYKKAGFKRDMQTFCLCHGEMPIAFFVVNQSDIGLNLSDLLNGIKIVVINDKEANWDIVASALNKISSCYKENKIPLLVYPHDYLSRQNIEITKHYQLWIIKNEPYSEQYAEYLDNNFRIRHRT
jgi:hypothetical protein